MYLTVRLYRCRIKERKGNYMKKEIIIRKRSSICREMITKTISGDIEWFRCDEFQDYLDVSGLSINHVNWLSDYLTYLKMLRHIPILDRTYFVFYQECVFAISQSEYSREVRPDFVSSIQENRIWHGVIALQEQLMQLLSLIEATDFNNVEENCRDLLYSTGCIHA